MSIRLALLSAVASLVAAAAPSVAGSAVPGQLDPTFGSGGVVRLLPSNEDIALRGVATQPDGRIVLAGADNVSGGTLVVRMLESGALDPSFGVAGIVALKLGSEGSEGRAVLVQPDGRIVVAGTAKGATDYDFAFARLNPDGSPDPSFGGGDGNVLVPVGPEADRAEALALGPGGRIVGTGEARKPPSEGDAGIVVLGPNGLPDPGYFGGDGAATVATALKYDEGVGAAMLADGRVLIGDSNGAGGGKGFTLIQLLPSGALDPSFGGGDGIAEAAPPSAGSETSLGGRIEDFELLAGGRIVASGYGYDEVGSPPKLDSKAVVARFLSDGQLDPTFGTEGFFTQQLSDGSESAEGIEVTPAGKLVVGGSYTAPAPTGTVNSPALSRLELNGILDPSFGAAGIVLFGPTAPFGENFEGAALDPWERTVVLGRAYVGGGNTEIVVRRFMGDIDPPRVVVPIRAPRAQPPRTRMKKVPRKVRANRLKGFFGTARDPDGGGLRRVQVAVTKVLPRGAKASARTGGPKCLAMKNARARFKPAKPRGPKGKKRCQPRWLKAKGTARWSFKLKRDLAPGRYVVYARAIDAAGLTETSFSRKAGNRYAFRVLAPR